MNQDHAIIAKVKQAKEDMRAADELIRAYMPFIRNQTAKFLKCAITEDAIVTSTRLSGTKPKPPSEREVDCEVQTKQDGRSLL